MINPQLEKESQYWFMRKKIEELEAKSTSIIKWVKASERKPEYNQDLNLRWLDTTPIHGYLNFDETFTTPCGVKPLNEIEWLDDPTKKSVTGNETDSYNKKIDELSVELKEIALTERVEKIKKDFSGSADYLSGVNDGLYTMMRELLPML